MATARCSVSTARLPDERSRMIEAGEVGADVVGADLTGFGAAEAGHRAHGLLAATIAAARAAFLAWVSAIHGPITAGSPPTSGLAR